MKKAADEETINKLKAAIVEKVVPNKRFMDQSFIANLDEDWLVFFDNTPKFPSILLNAVLSNTRANKDMKLTDNHLKVLLVKDKVSRLATMEELTLASSFYLELVLHKEDNNAAGEGLIRYHQVLSITINLKEHLDTELIVESAADLNLKLMKWRQVPDLDLLTPQQTSCLLLGSGSLGCQVARNLVSWGYRKITFVDAGKVSYSNPVRQCLFTYEDSIAPDNFKAPIAAKRLKEVFPMVKATGEILKIPMPGHAVASNDQAQAELYDNMERLNALVKDHDAIFLLTDSRESRWLPTVLANVHNKICLTIALGFESYLAMRHGLPARIHDEAEHGNRLGCYFCNDAVAPRNSLKDRSLDQQCTVSRPALCSIASALGVEMLTSILNHKKRHGAIARETAEDCDRSPLGIIPQ